MTEAAEWQRVAGGPAPVSACDAELTAAVQLVLKSEHEPRINLRHSCS